MKISQCDEDERENNVPMHIGITSNSQESSCKRTCFLVESDVENVEMEVLAEIVNNPLENTAVEPIRKPMKGKKFNRKFGKTALHQKNLTSTQFYTLEKKTWLKDGFHEWVY